MQTKLTTFLSVLLLAAMMAVPVQAQIFSGNSATTGTTFARPSSVAFCSPPAATTYPYDTNSVSVASDGDYAVQADWDGYDGYLLVYENSFDPLDPCTNLIALDDDFNGTGASRIESVDLLAANVYIIVASTFSALGTGGAYNGFVEQNDPPPVDEAGDIVNVAAADAVGQTSINGVIGESADEDCYSIEITDAANFTAEVDSLAPDGDSQLFLFDADDLSGVASDDDGGEGLLSRLDSTDVADAGITNGDYFLCITAFNNDPLDVDGNAIFPFGASLPDSSAALGSWTDGGSVAAPSTYAITLSGVTGGGGPNFDLMASGVPASVAPGSSFTVNFTVTNNTANPVTGDLFWTASPGGARANVFNDVTLAGGASVSNSYVQNVPATAPPGTYTYTVRIGQFPGTTVDSEVFTVMVTGPARGIDLDALLAEAKQSGDLNAYEAAFKGAEWTSVATRPWTSESNVSAAARTSEIGAFPNPFARSTEIGFELDSASDVSVVVYDVRGREVVTLVDETMEAGRHNVTFDAANLPSGVYIYRIAAGSQVETGRMTLLQ